MVLNCYGKRVLKKVLNCKDTKQKNREQDVNLPQVETEVWSLESKDKSNSSHDHSGTDAELFCIINHIHNVPLREFLELFDKSNHS